MVITYIPDLYFSTNDKLEFGSSTEESKLKEDINKVSDVPTYPSDLPCHVGLALIAPNVKGGKRGVSTN